MNGFDFDRTLADRVWLWFGVNLGTTGANRGWRITGDAEQFVLEGNDLRHGLYGRWETTKDGRVRVSLGHHRIEERLDGRSVHEIATALWTRVEEALLTEVVSAT